jgi:hypothetical protein
MSMIKATFRSFTTKAAAPLPKTIKFTGIKSLVGFNEKDELVKLENVDIIVS